MIPKKIRATIASTMALAALSHIALEARCEDGTEILEAGFFGSKIRPLVKSYCLGCHSTKAKKGGLDLQRFATLRQVRADIEPWQAVLHMLQSNEMPPRGKPRPRPEERRLLMTWVQALLEREARLRAGDPGPVLLRRLNNAEYTYTIRDLSGVALRPTREFPADGAAGEGFLNATDALAISPDLMIKYLRAAKEVAAHAVLLPDGFRFSDSKFREDWVNEVLRQIRALHARYATEIGEIPLDRYLKATLVHRDAIRSGKRSIAEVAKTEKLSPKYLRILWVVMTDDRPSILLDGIRSRWKKAKPEDVSLLAADVMSLQGLLWHKQEPNGAQAMDDRHVATSVSLVDRRTYKLPMPRYKPGDQAVFYVAAQVVSESKDRHRVMLERPRFELGQEKPLLLRDALRMAPKPRQTTPPSKGIERIELARFDGATLVLRGTEVVEVRLPGSLVSGRTFVVDARVDPSGSGETLVRIDVRPTPTPPRVERGLMWQYRENASRPPLLAVRPDDALRKKVAASADAFRRVFPAKACYPGVIVRDATVTLERFHRGDAYLSRLVLNEEEHKRLDRLWRELHYISQDALQVWDSLATLTKGEGVAYKAVEGELDRRAKAIRKSLLASEPKHLESLLEFAARAYRRPLTKKEQQSLRDLYQSLRRSKLPHDEAFRAVLARVLVSPHFLYRIEQPADGPEPKRVNDWELATRLSYFLWSSMPDDELRQVAAAGRLHDPQVLVRQTRRMLQDPRSRALAIEFGTQWLEVRGFDQFQGKNEELFPAFDAKLRQAMNEEAVLFFQDIFQADRPIGQLIDSDHAFLNETLARHYGIPGVRGEQFRRVEGVKKYGRGGMLGLGSVLAKHSGASRTSPVLRGNWIAETLLGERLPRPPDGVPKLPETETGGDRSIRQLVERHAKLQQCAVCHQRIDPLGFALEHYDTIGRRRDQDLGGRPVDAEARLPDGAAFEGIEGLRQYLLTQRKADFIRQYCRKLLGYALGRRVLFSDRELLKQMSSRLEDEDGRLSAAILAAVHSKQFQFVRGRGKKSN